ncbi:MAG: NAD-dependent epimerase/dehydratase family protein, partial [Candidatus Omnitrophica bacterium]|nr:NAD-dependent epimerase/dehydratase family protein [Candidatus Omnitrophota bacterium]
MSAKIEVRRDGFYREGRRWVWVGVNWRGIEYGWNFGATYAGAGIAANQAQIRTALAAMRQAGAEGRIATVDKVRMGLFDDARWLTRGYAAFRADIQAFLDVAAEQGMSVEFTLFDFLAVARGNFDMSPEATDRFVRDFLTPFLQDFGNHPALVVIDLINEPEWILAQGVPGGWGDKMEGGRVPIQAPAYYYFVKTLSQAIHQQAGGRLLVTIGTSAKHQATATNPSVRPHLTHYQLHHYLWMGALEGWVRQLPEDKPWVLGEYATRRERTDRSPAEYMKVVLTERGGGGADAWMWPPLRGQVDEETTRDTGDLIRQLQQNRAAVQQQVGAVSPDVHGARQELERRLASGLQNPKKIRRLERAIAKAERSSLSRLFGGFTVPFGFDQLHMTVSSWWASLSPEQQVGVALLGLLALGALAWGLLALTDRRRQHNRPAAQLLSKRFQYVDPLGRPKETDSVTLLVDPMQVGVQISVQDEMNGRALAFDRKHLMARERDPDTGQIKEHRGRDLKQLYGRRRTWDRHLQAVRQQCPGCEIVAAIGNSNLLFNAYVAGWVNGRVIAPVGEPIHERTYSSFVAYKDGTVRVEDLEYRLKPDGSTEVFSVPQQRAVTETIRFATSGQRVLKAGRPVPPAQIAEQWADLRWVFKFPYYQAGGIDTYFGMDQLLDEDAMPNGLARQAMEGEPVTLRLEIRGQPLEPDALRKALHDPESNYREVASPAQILSEGDYAIHGDEITIRLRPGLYPHNVIGLRADGLIVVSQIQGQSGRQGATLAGLSQWMQSQGVVDAILLDNGEDVKMYHEGRMVVRSFGDRQVHFSIIAFVREAQDQRAAPERPVISLAEDSAPLGFAAERIREHFEQAVRRVQPDGTPVMHYRYNPALEVPMTTSDEVPLLLAFVPERQQYDRFLPPEDVVPPGQTDVDKDHPEQPCFLCTLPMTKPWEFFDELIGATGSRYRLALNVNEYADEHVMVVAEDRLSNVFNNAARLHDLLLFTAARGPAYESWANAQGGGASQGAHWHVLSGRRRSPLWNALDAGRVTIRQPRHTGADVTYGELQGWPARARLYRGRDVEVLIRVVSAELSDLYANNIPPSLLVRVLPEGTFEVAISPMTWHRTVAKTYLFDAPDAARPALTSGTGAAEITGGVGLIYLPYRDLDEAQRRLAADRFAEMMRETTDWSWQPPAEPVAVTGASGFIGSSLARALAERNHPVAVLLRARPESEEKLRQRGVSAEVVTGDLLDREALTRLVDHSAVIYHFGGLSDRVASQKDPVEALAANALSAALIATLAKRTAKRVIYPSTQVIYEAGGLLQGQDLNEDIPLPIFQQPEVAEWLEMTRKAFANFADRYLADQAMTARDARAFVRAHLERHPIPDALARQVYGVSKYLGELLTATAPDHVVLRLTNVYGPGDTTDTKIAGWIRTMFANEPMTGNQAVWPDQRQYLYVDDLVEILHRIGSLKSPPKLLVVTNPQPVDGPELARTIQRLSGSTSAIDVDTSPETRRRIRQFEFDTSRLQETLGSSFAFTPLEDGLRATIIWQREQTAKTQAPTKVGLFAGIPLFADAAQWWASLSPEQQVVVGVILVGLAAAVIGWGLWRFARPRTPSPQRQPPADLHVQEPPAVPPATQATIEGRRRTIERFRNALDPAQPYTGYDVIVVSSTTEDEARYQQALLERAFAKIKTENAALAHQVLVLSVVDPAEGGQVIGQVYTWEQANAKARERNIDLAALVRNGQVKMAIYHNGGKGERASPLTQGLGNSRGAQRLVGVIPGSDGEPIEQELLLSVVLQTNAWAQVNDGHAVDTFWASQLLFDTQEPTAIPRTGAPIEKFVVMGDRGKVTGKQLFDLGTSLMQPDGTIVTFYGNKQFGRRNPATGRWEIVEERRHEWDREGFEFGFAYGSFRTNTDVFFALIDFWEQAGILDTIARQGKLKKADARDIDPHFIQPLVALLGGLSQITLPESLPVAAVLRGLAGEVRTTALSEASDALMVALPDATRQALSRTKPEIVREVVSFYLLNRDNPHIFPSDLTRTVGSIPLGAESHWLTYRRPIDIANEKFLMLSDLIGGVQELQPDGTADVRKAEPADLTLAEDVRAMRGIQEAAVARFTVNGHDITLSAEQVRQGVEVEGVYVRGSVIQGQTVLLPGSRIVHSVLSHVTGRVVADSSYLESTTVPALTASHSVVHKVIDANPVRAEREVVSDAYRPNLEDTGAPAGQVRMRVSIGYDPQAKLKDAAGQEVSQDQVTRTEGGRYTLADVRELPGYRSENDMIERLLRARALRQILPVDAAGNVTAGQVQARQVRNSTLVAEAGRVIVAEGLAGVVVVHGADGTVLVMPEARAQDVKQLMEAVVTAASTDTAILLQCEGCRARADAGRIAALGVKHLEIVQSGNTVTVRAMPATTPTPSAPSGGAAPETKELDVSPSSRDMKGPAAPETNPIIQRLIRDGQVVELTVEDGRLTAYQVQYVDGYTPGATDPSQYRGEEKAVGELLTNDQQQALLAWIAQHHVRGAPVRFRIALGQAALGWQNDIEHSTIAHAGYHDQVIYLGQTLLQHMLTLGHEALRTEVLDHDELRHLQEGDAFNHERDEPEAYQRRLDRVGGIVQALESQQVKSQNLNALKHVVTTSQGPTEVIAITNGGDGELVEGSFQRLAPQLFRADGQTTVMAHEEVTRRGQFLGLLDAIRHWKADGHTLDPHSVSLGIMMPGKGTRLSPLTQRLHGIKPFLPMLIHHGKKSEWFSGAAASLYSWTLVAYHLKRMGFRGMAWKWGDEPQVAANLMASMNLDLSDADAVRFGSELIVTEDLAANKEWLLRDSQTGELKMQVRRRPRAKLLERFGIEDHGEEVKALVHIGSPAFSYLFLEEAEHVFGDLSGWIDVDGYIFEALTQDRTTWEMELAQDKGMQTLVATYPDFYERVQELKRRIEARRGHPLVIKVIDFGEQLYWGDIGQLKKARAASYELNEATPEGEFARQLAAIDDVQPDQFGNRIIGDSLVPQDGSVRNSVIIDTKIYGKADIDGAVLVNSQLGNARIAYGSVVFGSTIVNLTMRENSYAFMSVARDLTMVSLYDDEALQRGAERERAMLVEARKPASARLEKLFHD